MSLINEPRPTLLGPPLAMPVSADTAPTPEDVVNFAREHDVQLVDLKFTDVPGTSVNLRSTIRTPSLSAIASTSDAWASVLPANFSIVSGSSPETRSRIALCSGVADMGSQIPPLAVIGAQGRGRPRGWPAPGPVDGRRAPDAGPRGIVMPSGARRQRPMAKERTEALDRRPKVAREAAGPVRGARTRAVPRPRRGARPTKGSAGARLRPRGPSGGRRGPTEAPVRRWPPAVPARGCRWPAAPLPCRRGPRRRCSGPRACRP